MHITKGALFIAANPDFYDALTGGRWQHATGLTLHTLITITGKTPYVVGKPNPDLVSLIMKDKQIPEK